MEITGVVALGTGSVALIIFLVVVIFKFCFLCANVLEIRNVLRKKEE